MKEELAYQRFLLFRWPKTLGSPVCPYCNSPKIYHLSSRRKFRCANSKCRRDFTATTKTGLSSRKLSFAKLCEMIDSVTVGRNSPHAAIILGVNDKTIRRREKWLVNLGRLTYTGGTEKTNFTWNFPYAYRSSPARIEWYDEIIRAVPEGFADWLRADICQNMALGILERVNSIADVKLDAKKAIREAFKFYDMTYKTISLFAPIGSSDDGDIALIDTISTEQYQQAFA